MRYLISFYILFFGVIVQAEELLVDGYIWQKGRSMRSLVYCALRGHDFNDGSIKCYSEVMKTLDSRFSFTNSRIPLNADGSFEYNFDGETARGKERYHLSGKVVKVDGKISLQFASFRHELVVLKYIELFDVRFKNFSAPTELIKTDLHEVDDFETVEKCKEMVKFEKERIPVYCSWRGFPKTTWNFTNECSKNGSQFKMEYYAHCID